MGYAVELYFDEQSEMIISELTRKIDGFLPLKSLLAIFALCHNC